MCVAVMMTSCGPEDEAAGCREHEGEYCGCRESGPLRWAGHAMVVMTVGGLLPSLSSALRYA